MGESTMHTNGKSLSMLGLLALGNLGAITVPAPAPARACSCLNKLIESSIPVHGAHDVPIDIAPLIIGNYTYTPDILAFEREDGTPVEFELRVENGAQPCSGQSGELLPSAELEPNTVYVIRAGARDDDQAPRVVFTTGTQRAATPVLDAPAVAATFTAIEPDICPGGVRGCISIEGAERAEVVLRDGSTKAVGLTDGPSLNLGPMEWIPTCIDVRARDDAGRWSATTTLCSDDFVAHDAATSDFEGEQPRCPGGIPGDVDGDDSANAEADASRAVCSAATTAAGFAAWHAPLLALLIVLRRARRKPERSGRGATD